MAVLHQNLDILKKFQNKLKSISASEQSMIVKDIIQLFPKIEQAEHDLKLFQSLIDQAAFPRFLSIVLFWKDRSRIRHIYAGITQLLTKAKVSPTTESTLFIDIDENTLGSKCASIYDQYQKTIATKSPEKILTLISYYSSSLDFFDFLESLSADDVYNLQEAVNDWDETLVNTKVIFDFALVKNFIDRSYAAMTKNIPRQLEDIIASFIDVWQDQQFDDLLNCLESSSLALSSIKRIHIELTDKEQSKRRQIADILQNSSVGFIRTGHHLVTFDITIEILREQTVINQEEKKKQQNITFAVISELRDRARLLEYSSNINRKNLSSIEMERDKERLRNFIHLASVVESTIDILTKLYTTGHPSISEYLIDRKGFLCKDGEFTRLEENHKHLNNLLNEWEEKLLSMYRKYINLTYFSGDQFWQIENYIYDRSSLSHSGYHLLKFIGIESNSIKQPTNHPQNPDERLENLGQLLSQISNLQGENSKLKRCFLIETTNEGVLRAILSLFSLTNSQPSVQHVFYCTQRTSWIELRGFVYRCFYSRSCHQLIRPEFLSQLIQDQFINLLRSLIEKQPDQVFQIGIVTTATANDQQMINGLQSMQILTILRDQELMNNDELSITIQKLIRNCRLVTSKITGLGKSRFIQQTIKSSNKNYTKFSISGDFDVDTLAERLSSKYSHLQNAAVHLDIGMIDNSQQLNEILYCLLLFGSFRFGQVAVAIPADTEIFIELDASPQSILTEISFFKYIKQLHHIDHMNWSTLDVNNDQIKIVANYLQAILNRTIVKQNIDPTKFKPLTVEICSRLIQEFFLKDKNAEFITWTQLSIFIAVFCRLFTGFSRCGYFLVQHVHDPQLRTDLIQTLLQSSNQFTSLSVENVRKQQRSVTNNDIIPFSDAIIRWDKIQPFTLIFTATDEPLFVYKNLSNVPSTLIKYFQLYSRVTQRRQEVSNEIMFPDYTKLTHTELFIKLASLSTKYLNKSICPNCYRQFEYKENQCQQCPIKNTLIKPASFDHTDVIKFQTQIAKSLQKDYILTADNFAKMLLVYMRVQSNIPVIIMGETGCGKTALIKFLCQKILDDELEVFRIHAGVTVDDITVEMQKYIEKSKQCQGQNKRRLWIFFDEFNTTSNIGLLKEIICERTLLGESLPGNMVFLAACNPRRKKMKKLEINEDEHIGLRKNRYEEQKLLWTSTDRRLVHNVVSIPETMLEYIWDYGYLDQSTERSYIRTMLNMCRDLSNDQKLFDLTVELLVRSQNHFRDLEDVSSVSLRDIARFCRLYNWFLSSLKQRTTETITEAKLISLVRRASLIALLLCYYFRLRSVKLQQIYIDQMQNIMAKDNPNIRQMPDYLTNRILESEQKELIDGKMELPEGTASNRALRNNIFVLFACIVNRIPLFLCGKPGSSKSSAVQILISNLRGKKSRDPYFQTLPELVAVSFQGSQNCTSESIIKVFERAENYSRVKNQSELLPVIVFDEIGLAELSPHNPLKVLHAKLEVENNQYGFVGISNWRLDASKMNRALYLSTPEPNIDDLKLTGKIISASMQSQGGYSDVTIEPIITESLSQAYHNLCESLKEAPIDQQNYFGLRDYYSLIRGIVRELIKRKQQANIHEIVRQQLKINFDGVLDGTSLLWKSFCHDINQENLYNQYANPSFDLILNETLNIRSGRYLLLIAENESSIDYVERFIRLHHQKSNIPVKTLVGSSFPGDLLSGNTYAEQYNYRVLMDVILYAETNITLIMRQKGHVYDNLYDLFNQNFAVSAKKKYCRIALGPLYHPRCLIHDDFYCVVFILRRDLDKCDPPFLNRFEKHVIDMQALIHPRHKLIINHLDIWLKTLLPDCLGKHFPVFQHLFVDYSPDRICNLVMETFDELNISLDAEETDQEQRQIIEHCQAKLLRTSSFDLPLVLSLQPNHETTKLIDQYYDRRQSFTFKTLIDTSVNSTHPRLIYTYTQIFQRIEGLPSDVEEIKLNAFKTELELTNKIKRFYQDQETKLTRLLLIRVDYHHEHEHILSLKHALLNERQLDSHRDIWLIFHLQRNLLNQITNDVLFSNWSIDMIDDLNKEDFIPKNILELPSYRSLVLSPQYTLSSCAFNDLVDRSLAKIRYIVPNQNDEKEINKRRYRICQQIIENNPVSSSQDICLRSIIEPILMTLIKTVDISTDTRFTDWRLDLLTNGLTIASSRSFNDALQTTISMFHETYFFLFLTHLEKYCFLDAFHYLSNVDNNKPQQDLWILWKDCLTKTMETMDLTKMNLDIAEIQLVFNLRLPCATLEYENIRMIREKIEQLQADNNQSFDCFNSIINEIKKTSIYGDEFMELVFNDQRYFNLYFYDQIALLLSERNIDLKPQSVLDLLINNPTYSLEQKARIFFAQHTEFIEIVRLFEIGTQLTTEKEIYQVITTQLIENPRGNIKPSEFYSLVIANEHFYQLPPQITSIDDQYKFNCTSDPMIETSLMNLIELILSLPVILRATSLEQITTKYSLIAHGVHDLESYWVSNLEKLRSFISLIRCLTALLPADGAFDVFKGVCQQRFDGKFVSCQAIQQFVTGLTKLIKSGGSTSTENVIHRTLIKLEVDFLKDWLAHNGESYGETLILMNEKNSDLWQYSAKILTYIDRRLDLFSTLKENNGRIPLNDDYEQFNHHLTVANEPTYKVQRLLVNRFHMLLMRDASADLIEQQLIEHLPHFAENLQEIQKNYQVINLQLISMIAWVKYYAQIYSFALNNDSRENVLTKIDELLTKTNTPFGSTLKLFIFKQLLQTSGLSLNVIRDVYVNRNIVWIKPYIQRPRDLQTQNIRRNFILPTPLFECQQEFQRISEILNDINEVVKLKQIIHECSTSQKLTYAFFIWFIQYYCRFLQENIEPDVGFIQLIEHVNQDLVSSFTPIGHRFLLSLCSNFSDNSYFRLQSTMKPTEIHQRFVALNIIAVLISFRALPQQTLLSNLLFNNTKQMPNNYLQHISNICQPGLTVSDPVIAQMIDVRDQVRDRLNRGVIHAGGKFIFQCSENCPWVFIFHDCGVPNDRFICVLCKKPIGAQGYNVLIKRNPPQIQMPIDKGLKMIDQRIEEYNRNVRVGYHNTKSADTSVIGEKSDHLDRPVSFRFIHLLTHSVLLFLHDLNYLTDADLTQHLKLSKTTHFRDHYEKDYSLIAQSSTDHQQCHIWLYKLLNHLINEEFAKAGLLNTNENVIKLEQMLEQKLIFVHNESITNEIAEYKRAYAEFNQERDSKPSLDNFIDELFENENDYPLLNFFNVTTFHTSDLLNEFILKMQTVPHAEQTYPVTTFLFKRFHDYMNIQYLYSIVAFSNYLIEKFNHRIKRNDAAEKKIVEYLFQGSDNSTFQQLYDAFLHSWYALDLKEVRYGCQAPKFVHTVTKEKFAENTSIATLLLNTSRDESSLLLAATMKTIAELQNEIVHYFSNVIERDVNTQIQRKQIPLQSIRPENILRLNPNELSQKLVDDSLVVNYQYGKGKDIIYDCEEIEITLRNMISSLVLIDTDTEKLHFLNYQFELYGENSSLINAVRARIKQKQLPNDIRTKLHSLLIAMNHDDILNYLGSLDYVFTYLRNSISENATETTEIQKFVEIHIHSHSCLNENILNRPPFSTIELQFIIDLYEMIEEIAFDQVLRAYVKKELTEEKFSVEERQRVLSVFSRTTFAKDTIAPTLKSIGAWISMLKRLMIRVLNANVSLEVPLQVYLERTDLWSDRVNAEDLGTFEVDEDVLLQHTYVILQGLEQKQQPTTQRSQTTNLQSVEGQRQKTQTWFTTTATLATTPKVLTNKQGDKSRIRV